MSTDYDLPWRRDCLGGSDAPAIVGVDPWRTAGDVWAVKTGRVPIEESREAFSPMILGSAVEPILVDIAAESIGHPVARQVHYRHPTAPLGVSVDGIDLEPPGLLIEAKSAGLLGRSPLLAAYGEDGSGTVPDSVVIQLHHAFAVLDAQEDVPRLTRALVVALLGGLGVRTYTITRDDHLVAELLGLETEWWTRYVIGNERPPTDPPSLATLRAFQRRKTPTPKPIDTTLVSEWLQAKAVLKQAESNEETCRRFVLAELGDDELGECQLGRVSFKEVARKGYHVAPTTMRVLRFTPARGAHS